ncbi:MAG: adenosylmethionine decarboxylase [bacterium JZ-2024 1]
MSRKSGVIVTHSEVTKGARTALGRHLLADFYGVSQERMSDPASLLERIHEAVHAAGATLIDVRWHAFSPQGLTLFALLKESHLAVHTWPEKDYVAIDIFTCGASDPRTALNALQKYLKPRFANVRDVLRGELR